MPFVSQSSGYLQNTITEIRKLADSPRLRVKYTDSELLAKISEGFQEVIRDLYNSATKKPMSRVDITLVSGTEYYAIPPTVGEIRRIVQFQSDGITIQDEFRPRHFYHLMGPGIQIDSNHRIWVPSKNVDGTFTLFYYPTGDFIPYVGYVDKTTASTSGFTMKSASPYSVLGEIDRRSNAYVGGLVRLLQHQTAAQLPSGATQFPINERAIQTYSNYTGAITVKPVFDFDPSTLTDTSDAHLLYEVVPADSAYLWPCVARYVARTLCLTDGKRAKAGGLQRLYDEAKRSITLQWMNMQTRMPQVFETEVTDDFQHMAIY